jgi:hypothetical protein
MSHFSKVEKLGAAKSDVIYSAKKAKDSTDSSAAAIVPEAAATTKKLDLTWWREDGTPAPAADHPPIASSEVAKAIEDFKIPGKDLFDSFLEYKLQKAKHSKGGGYKPDKITALHCQGVLENPYGLIVILSKEIQIKSGLLLGDIQDFLFKTHFPGLTKKHKEVRSKEKARPRVEARYPVKRSLPKVKADRTCLVLGRVPERPSGGGSSQRCLSVLSEVYLALPPQYRELHDKLLATIDVHGEGIIEKTFNLMDLHISHIIGRVAIYRRVDDIVSFIKAGIDRALTDAIGLVLFEYKDFKSLFADEMANFYNETINILQCVADREKAAVARLETIENLKKKFDPDTGFPFMTNIKGMVMRFGGNIRVAPRNDSGDKHDGMVPQLNYDSSGASTPRSTAIKKSWDDSPASSGEVSVFSEFFGFLRVIADNKKGGQEVETTTTSPVWNRLVASLNGAFVSISNLKDSSSTDDYRQIARQYMFSLYGFDPNSLGCLAPSCYYEEKPIEEYPKNKLDLGNLDLSAFDQLDPKVEDLENAIRRRLIEVLSFWVSEGGVEVLPVDARDLDGFLSNFDARLGNASILEHKGCVEYSLERLGEINELWKELSIQKCRNSIGSQRNKFLFIKLHPVISRFISDQIKKQERSNLGLVLGASGGCLTTLRDSRECLTPMSESRPDDNSPVTIAGT